MKRILLLVTIFSIAMGFMETAIVVYLRELYYPNGFHFPLNVIPPNIGIIEILREAATMIMLVIIGIIAGKNSFQRFCFFLFSFAVWDLFYYIFLKIFLDWPESLFTWDILFLIPVPWIGPVLAPCILSITMILLTLTMAYHHERKNHLIPGKREWILLICGSVTILISFIWDYLTLAASVTDTSGQEMLFENFKHYIPQSYNWILFWSGELILLIGIYLISKKKSVPNSNEFRKSIS